MLDFSSLASPAQNPVSFLSPLSQTMAPCCLLPLLFFYCRRHACSRGSHPFVGGVSGAEVHLSSWSPLRRTTAACCSLSVCCVYAASLFMSSIIQMPYTTACRRDRLSSPFSPLLRRRRGPFGATNPGVHASCCSRSITPSLP